MQENELPQSDSSNNSELLKEIRSTVQSAVKDEVNKNNGKLLRINLGIGILVLLLFLGVNLFILNGNQNNKDNFIGEFASKVVNSTLPSIPKTENNLEISNFYNNQAISELGASLKTSSTSIVTQNSTNCQTPILPPEINGCGFVFLPNLSGLPATKKIFNRLYVQGSLGEGSQIQVNLKNYQKASATKEIGVIKSIDQKIMLPENIDSVEGISFQLWQKGGPIKIEKINIEYFYVENLKELNFKINNFSLLESQTGSIYLDQNENGKLDITLDKEWTCRPNFPGVKMFKVSKKEDVTVLRDDTCYNQVKPDNWKLDSGKAVLPAGKWLLYFAESKKAFSFEIKNLDANSISIDL